MKQFRVLVLILSVCATNALGGSGTPLYRRQFAIIDIAQSTGGNAGWASAVNNVGQVVGVANTRTNSLYSAFVYDQAGGLRFLPVPSGGVLTTPHAINGNGNVVGYTSINFQRRALLWTADGQRVDLHPGPEWDESEAMSINDRDHVVGYARSYTGNFAGFVYDPAIGTVIMYNHGPFIDLNNRGEILDGSEVLIYDGGFFGGSSIPFPVRELRAISDAGIVVGTINGSQGWPRAFFWNSRRHREPTELGTLPTGLQSYAYAVNSLGQIVGASSINGFDMGRAVLWEGKNIYDLNNYLPANGDWTLRVARGINDDGYIVGSGGNSRGQAPFLLVPLQKRPSR